MDTILTNEWITLSQQRHGLTVQRKYAGINTLCDELNNKVLYCIISYYERELCPDGTPNKSFLKSYTLTDLERVEWIDTAATYDENGVELTPAIIKYRNELKVLTGFVNSLGNNYIIAPTRVTIENLAVLPLEHEQNYPLHRDTRTINTL